MKSLLFIGFDFHQKTGSVDFLLEFLKKNFLVSCCYVDLFSDDPYSVLKEVSKTEFNVLVCLQTMPPRTLLDKIFQFDHAVLFPMLDGCPSVVKTEKWWPYRDFNIICFSKVLETKLCKAGFSTKYIQYFPKPADNSRFGDPDSAFFWCRRESINVPLVEHLFSTESLRHLHVHKVPDPDNNFIEPTVDSLINFTYSTWYENKEDMLADIASSAYYIAPRPKEGIGMSFLEAMAMGKCVVAPDEPTMNEYIEHGKTGLLYNLKNPAPFSAVNIQEIQKATYCFIQQGYRQWEQEKEKIPRWLEGSADISKIRMFLYMVRRFFKNPLKTGRVLREEYRRSM